MGLDECGKVFEDHLTRALRDLWVWARDILIKDKYSERNLTVSEILSFSFVLNNSPAAIFKQFYQCRLWPVESRVKITKNDRKKCPFVIQYKKRGFLRFGVGWWWWSWCW
jgi:hypothetical protein